MAHCNTNHLISGLKKSGLFFVLAVFLNSFPVWGGINFSDLDISEDNRILFKLNFTGNLLRESLFVSGMEDGTLRQLTVIPERMDLIDNGRTLLIRNALGSVRIPVRGGLPQEGHFPQVFETGRVDETAVSPDGRWVLTLEPETPAYGTLVLEDVITGERIAIAAGIERQDKIFPASWSPDSRVIVYSRSGRLYYCMVNPGMADSGLIDERFRLIGEGTINSIVWDQRSDFYYLRGSTVYKVRVTELFARVFYADFLDIGSVTGRIPLEFDPFFDEWRISPEADSILLKKGLNLFYFPLANDDYLTAQSGIPFLALPRSCFNVRIIWSTAGGITVLASARHDGNEQVLAWRLDPESGSSAFVPLASPMGAGANLSPDGRTILLWGSRGIALYDYANWKLLEVISTRPVYNCLWIGNNEIIIGDEDYIERVILFPGDNGRIISRELICLSRASRFGFEIQAPENGSPPRILANNDGTWYATDGKSPWTEITNVQIRPASQVSGRFRVYLENQSSGPFGNLPMVRSMASVGTFPLIQIPETGSRENSRQLGLCFDLYDDIEGLPETLEALYRHGIKATFFLGGEFIRRFPSAAADIAAAGHETASLFFAALDLTDSRYRINDEFITRGLARNEDEYFNATGRELALLWHPPWYAVSPQIRTAAANAGYLTAGRDVDPFDWVSLEDEKQFGLPRYSAAEMIDRIINMAGPEMIIPVRMGLLPGGRGEYLYQRINLLLDVLVQEGYEIVPVSALIDHVQ